MSLPQFPTPDPCLTQEQALNWILTSIAMEEAALSHILEAESEKIKSVLCRFEDEDCCVGIESVLAVNKSVNDLLESVMDNQLILKKKMERALEYLPKPPPGPCFCPPEPCPPEPSPPPCPPVPCCLQQCHAVFEPNIRQWCCNCTLPLKQCSAACSCIALWPLGHCKILLPECRRVLIEFRFQLLQPYPSVQPAAISLQLKKQDNVLVTERFEATDTCGIICISGSTVVETQAGFPQSRISFALCSPGCVFIESGSIDISSI